MTPSTTDLVSLRKQILPLEPLRLYAMVDAAGNASALDFLYEHESLSFDCLFQGDVDPDVFEAAPFLVDLQDQPEVLDWMLEGWGESWVSFVHSELTLADLQIHLRQFTKVRTPDGEVVWFRFYDPSVMRTAIPVLNTEQCNQLFKSVALFLSEGEAPNSLVRLSFDGSKPLVSTIQLA
jgi:hypothetical protein